METPAPIPRPPDGYEARPLRMDDAEAVAVLLNEHTRRLRGEDATSPEELRVEWATPNWSPETGAVVVAAPDGRLVVYADYFDTLEPHVRPFAWARVHPDHTGRGLGGWALDWIESRAPETLARAKPGLRIGIQTSAIAEDRAAQELFTARGWKPVRNYYSMRIEFDGPPPAPVLPDGIEIRTFGEDVPLRDLAQAVDDCFADHWGHFPSDMDEQMKHWEHWIAEDPKHDPTLWFLAMADGEIAGMSLCSEEEEGAPERAYCSTLGVRREHRRKGLGIALLRISFAEAHRRGKAGLGLDVDAASLTGATKLYEKAGMHVARESHAFEKVIREGEDVQTRDAP
jgi:GNAT superfamily N-acetyltransferase